MLRRLHHEQPETFAYLPANHAWAEAQIAKYPENRQASAVIPLLWRAQEQEGWLSRPAIEHVAAMLGMANIRVLEVATFYFMFQLQPVGSVAHVQVCGTLSCMICGAEDLVAKCKEMIAQNPHEVSADGKFSWEEVECLGACTNAPMVQIGKDYYEDLTSERFVEILGELAAGRVPVPGPQNGRYAAEPLSGLTALQDHADGRPALNASAALAVRIGDTVKRIDGTEVPLLAPWRDRGAHRDRTASAVPQAFASAEAGATQTRETVKPEADMAKAEAAAPKVDVETAPAKAKPVAVAEVKSSADATVQTKTSDVAATKDNASDAGGSKSQSASLSQQGKAVQDSLPDSAAAEGHVAPELLKAARGGAADDLKRISGVGPKLEDVLNEMGFWHFSQVAEWGAGEIAWVDSRLKFKGRIVRDDWVAQAKVLAAEV